MPWPEGANGAAAAERPLDDVNACEGGAQSSRGGFETVDFARRVSKQLVARQSATTSHMRWSTSTSIPSIHVVSSANDEEFCLDGADASRSSSRMLTGTQSPWSTRGQGVSELGAGNHAARDSAAARRFSGDRTSSSSSSSVASSSVSDDDGARLRLCRVSRGHRHVTSPRRALAPSRLVRSPTPNSSSSSPSCVWLWRRGRVEIGEDRARPGGDAAAFARIEDPASTGTERSIPAAKVAARRAVVGGGSTVPSAGVLGNRRVTGESGYRALRGGGGGARPCRRSRRSRVRHTWLDTADA